MKKLFYVLPLAVLFYACGEQGGAAVNTKNAALNTLGDSISYSMGMSMVRDIDTYFDDIDELDFNEPVFIAGIKEGLAKDTRFDEAQNKAIISKFQMLAQTAQMKKQQEAGEKGRVEGQKFLTENATKEGVKTTASGLQYKVNKEGSGASPTATDKVKVHYEGKLINGTVFDSSIKGGKPAEFGLNQVIPGWTEGIQLMKPGAKYTFYIPSELGYGARGAGADIPPNSTLIFEVELLEIL